jgi:hypothetical protein
MVARRHHFLPQCYLKGFGQPRKRGKIHNVVVFDRDGKQFTSNILNVAVKRDFNRIEIQGKAPDFFELAMADFEGALAPALERIIAAGNLRNTEDRATLLNFIGLISIRNPRHRETFRDFNEQVLGAVMDLATATKERWEGQIKRAQEAGYLKKAKDISYEEMRDFVRKKEYRIELRTEFHIATEMKSFDTVLQTLFRRKWVAFTPPSKSSGFITSDHPVCLMFSDPNKRGGFYGPGHGLAGTEIIFPIGRRLAAVGAFELDDGEMALTEEGVAGINGALVAYADRQVYARDVDFTYSRQYGEEPRSGSALVKDTLFLRAKEASKKRDHRDNV